MHAKISAKLLRLEVQMQQSTFLPTASNLNTIPDLIRLIVTDEADFFVPIFVLMQNQLKKNGTR
jgi:hypothetical protein